MAIMIQIRHVPNEIHRKLKARAALEGMSLSDFLLREVRGIAERPSVSELRARVLGRSSITPSESPTKAVRAERNAR